MKPVRKRVVLDTNVLVSALILPSSIPAKALAKALDECSLFLSTETLAELQDVLQREKFDRYFHPDDDARARFLRLYALKCIPVEITENVTACPDPKDNKFLSVAVAANAHVLVSGDKKHVLKMNPYRGIRIVTAKEFLSG